MCLVILDVFLGNSMLSHLGYHPSRSPADCHMAKSAILCSLLCYLKGSVLCNLQWRVKHRQMCAEIHAFMIFSSHRKRSQCVHHNWGPEMKMWEDSTPLLGVKTKHHFILTPQRLKGQKERLLCKQFYHPMEIAIDFEMRAKRRKFLKGMKWQKSHPEMMGGKHLYKKTYQWFHKKSARLWITPPAMASPE